MISDLNLTSEIQFLWGLISNNRFCQAIIGCSSLLENYLRKIFKEISASITPDVSKKINDYLVKKGKIVKDMTFGELIGLFRKAGILKIYSKEIRKNFTHFNDNNLNIINEIRNKCIHRGYGSSVNEAKLIFFTLKIIFEEIGIIDRESNMKKKVEEPINLEYLKELNLEAYEFASSNNKEEALKTAIKLVNLAPTSGDYWDSYGEILMIFNDYENAINKFKIAPLIDQEGDYIHETYIKMGNCYKELNNYKLALENIVKGKEIAEEREELDWVNQANDYISEIKKIEISIELDDLDELNLEAYEFAKSNKKEEALKTVLKLVNLAPTSGDYWDSYGEILMMFNDYENAINKFKIALQLDQNGYYVHETYIKMGNCYKELNNYKLALENIVKGKEIAEEREELDWVNQANDYISEIKKRNNPS